MSPRIVFLLNILIFGMFCPNSVLSQRWEKITNIQAQYNLPTDYYLDIYFLPSNPQLGWACGYSGKTLRTIDGGVSWLGSSVASIEMLESIQFLTPQIGYTSGPGGVFKSIDGGISWINVSNSITGDLWGLYFLSIDYGVVIGGGCATNQNFNHTTNGGTTWNTSTYSIPNTGLTDPILLSDGVGFASSSGRIWKSLDSGKTWNVASSTGDVGWQEEITFLNGTIVVPTAGDNCQGGTNGSLRFSSDSGITWKSFPIPYNMFGTYIIDQQRAWGCGLAGSIYYTDNAGISWDLKNCGIGGVDLDDVFFINDTTGFVVGSGIFRLVPSSRTISKNTIDFGTFCIPGSKVELVSASNSSFSDVSISVTLLTNEDNSFMIVNDNQQPFQIGKCEQRSVGILFAPTTEGLKTCSLKISFSTGEEYIVIASGIATTRKSQPADTIVFFDSTQCNTLQYTNALWYNTGFVEEKISEVIFDSGSSRILYLSPPTLRIPPKDSINIVYSVILNDTGWVSTRYRFKVEPCNNFSYQDVYVYGISSIINAVDSIRFRSTCEQNTFDSLKIKNTGNDSLILRNPRVLGPNSSSFTIVSYNDGTNAFQLKKVAPNDSIYLLIQFTPSILGNVTAQLEILTNDSTKERGNKAIFKGSLLGFWGAPDLSSDKKVIDFDSICVGTFLSDTITIYNLGVVAAEFEPLEFDKNNILVLLTQGTFPIVIEPKDSTKIVITALPQKIGKVKDTIWLVSSTCNLEKYIVVEFFGKQGILSINPTTVNHQVLQSTYDTSSVVVKNLGNVAVNISTISFVPANAKLEILFPKTSRILEPNDTFSVVYRYTAGLLETIQSTIQCIPNLDECSNVASIPIIVRGVGSLLLLSDTLITISQRCSTETLCKQVSLVNRGISPDTIIQVSILSSSVTPISISNQISVGFVIRADETVTSTLCYSPLSEGSQVDTLFVLTANSDKPLILLINSTYYKTSTTIADSIFDFGIVRKCDSIQILSTTLVNSGSLKDTLDLVVPESSSLNDFFVPLEVSILGNDSSIFSITSDPISFVSKTEGIYSGRFVYRSRICGTIIVINAICEYIDPKLVLSSSNLDFGQIWMDDSRIDSIEISNTSTYPITIQNGDFTNRQLGFTINTLDFPITLLPDSSTFIKVFFTATVEGISTTDLTFYMQSACADSQIVQVTANVPFESYSVSFGLEDKSGVPGEEVIFPIFLYDSLTRAKVSEIEFSIGFDSRLLSPKGILLPWTVPPRLIPFIYTNNILSFSVPQNEKFDLGRQPMQIARIITRALLNKPDKTPLNFISIIPVTTKRVSTSSRNGSFTISVCGIRSGLESLPIALVAFPHPVVNNSEIEITIGTSADQFADIEIYSILGISQNNVRMSLNHSQTNTLVLPVDKLGNGTYFLVVKTQYGEVFQQQIILHN